MQLQLMDHMGYWANSAFNSNNYTLAKLKQIAKNLAKKVNGTYRINRGGKILFMTNVR